MTNLKKIGLTALAGTLAATTFAQAGDLSVSGTARMEYQSTQTNAVDRFNLGGADSASDAFAQNATITFSGSGEMDNGHTVSYFQALSAGALTSQGVTVDMGDMGAVSMASANLAGIGTIQDMVPNGGEQPWDDLGTAAQHGKPEQGVASPHAGNRLGYSTSVGGATISAAANYEFAAATTSLAIAMPNLVEGLNIGVGIATDQASETAENDIETAYISYAMGAFSVGYQTTSVDAQAANSDIDRTGYGISFAVNENFSVGYGVSDVEFDALAADEESRGFGASYTVGGMKVGLINNKKDNMGGGTTNMEMTELQLTFAF
jgi:outer membrane protein OmpU